MTVVHIVLCKIKTDLKTEQVDQFKEASHKFGAEQELKSLHSEFKWSAPAYDARAKGYDWGLYSVFPDLETLQKYNVHPLHTEFVKNIMRPNTDDLLAYDFEY